MTASRTAIVLAAAMLGSLMTSPATAQTCVTPEQVRIPAARATHEPIVLHWDLPFESTFGYVRDTAGNLIQTLGPHAPGAFTETIVLPPDTVQQLIQSGRRRLLITRPTAGPNCRAIVEYTGPLGGPLSITRIQLRFDEGSPLRIVPLDSEVHAWADLVYAGSGELVARWEVAGPESSGGAPQFTVLDRVRRQIGGGGRTSLESPKLPTDRTGLFLVRLKIEPTSDQHLDFEEPTLRYYVSQDGGARAAPAIITVFEPSHLGELHADTLFRWAPLDGARAYRVELHDYEAVEHRYLRFDAGNPAFAELRSPGGRERTHEAFGPTMAPGAPEVPDGRPAAGVLVTGDASETRLSDWAFRELEPGRSYVFVVRAMAAGGIPIGVSPPRLLHVPNE